MKERKIDFGLIDEVFRVSYFIERSLTTGILPYHLVNNFTDTVARSEIVNGVFLTSFTENLGKDLETIQGTANIQ